MPANQQSFSEQSYPVHPGGRVVFEPIERRDRISMRDPQQQPEAGVSSFELPAFEFTGNRHPEHESRQLLDDARETATSMIAQTRASLDAEVEEARRQGHADGFREGLAIADRDSAGLLAVAEQIAGNMARERDSLLERSEEQVVELALAISERIVNAAIDADPTLVLEVCRGAMRKAFQRETLVVLAHPEDLQMLRDAGPAMAAELGGIHQLDFVEERRLDRGSVIVRTPVGEIDATFGAKRDKVHESLRELMDTRRAEVRVDAAS